MHSASLKAQVSSIKLRTRKKQKKMLSFLVVSVVAAVFISTIAYFSVQIIPSEVLVPYEL